MGLLAMEYRALLSVLSKQPETKINLPVPELIRRCEETLKELHFT